MSILIDSAVACPGCGKGEVRRVARSLNAERSPELVEAILGERFQRFACGTCNYPYLVEDPFVFVDFAARLWIAHFPRAWEARWAALEEQADAVHRRALAEHGSKLVRDLGAGFTVRVVFGLAALREKLLCLRVGPEARIDDRLLEALKLDLMRGTKALRLGLSWRPVLVRVEGDGLVLRAGEELWRVERARLAQYAAPAWAAALEELSAGPYVDVGRLLSATEVDLRKTG